MAELVGLAVIGCGGSDPAPFNDPVPVVAPAQPGGSEGESAGEALASEVTQTSTESAPGDAETETEGSEGSEVEPGQRRVTARVLDFRASADRGQIQRLVRELAMSCYKRELLRSPGAAGRLVLDFGLHGDRKGPVFLKIEGEQELPKLASCMRQRMAAARWPTGFIDGMGLVKIRLDFAPAHD